MANPFPGMDPFLEGPFWGTFHANLMDAIAWQLAPKLKPKYLALTNQRVVIAVPDPIETPATRLRVPDVGIFHATDGAGTLAEAAIAAPLLVEGVMPETMRQTMLEVRDAESRQLITAIEVLSPTNKRGDGAFEYRQKRNELLSSPANFIEIDLLRIGDRFPMVSALPSVPYFVFVSRAISRPRVEAWPIALAQELPTIPVPLRAEDPDVTLDLQAAYRSVYEHFSYDIAVDHRCPLAVPLREDQQQWVDARLKEAGIE